MATVGGLLRRARDDLQAHGDSPDLDAQLLLAHVLGVAATWLYANPQTTVTVADGARFRQLLERRAAGEPVAYLVGECGFWTLDLAVTPAVLIPRPDTETLVQAALDTLPDTAISLVDLGTGSGAIALALASERRHWRISATDASLQALECARANAERLNLARVQFHHGNWFEPLAGMRFDAIVSNPPYVADDDPHLRAPELTHEPMTALVADNNGLADLAHIAAHAPRHLRPDGWLMLEHGFEQGPAVRALLLAAGFQNVETLLDLAGRARVTRGRIGR